MNITKKVEEIRTHARKAIHASRIRASGPSHMPSLSFFSFSQKKNTCDGYLCYFIYKKINFICFLKYIGSFQKMRYLFNQHLSFLALVYKFQVFRSHANLAYGLSKWLVLISHIYNCGAYHYQYNNVDSIPSFTLLGQFNDAFSSSL